VAWQSDEGAFVDWARFRLLGGDEMPELSQAYSACREALIARRNKLSPSHSHRRWCNGTPTSRRLDGRVVPVESVLEHVLAPIAAAHPTLLLVMDGLSTSIFRELFARIASHGWAEMVPSSDIGQPLVGVAALPTITEVSRASLLCGRLMTGRCRAGEDRLRNERGPAGAQPRGRAAPAVPQGRPGRCDQPGTRRCAPRLRAPISV
jgi:hypothetical protein